MRVDERRVARGQATLWRTMLHKGPKSTGRDSTVSVEGGDGEPDTILKKGVHRGAERDLQNLTV